MLRKILVIFWIALCCTAIGKQRRLLVKTQQATLVPFVLDQKPFVQNDYRLCGQTWSHYGVYGYGNTTKVIDYLINKVVWEKPNAPCWEVSENGIMAYTYRSTFYVMQLGSLKHLWHTKKGCDSPNIDRSYLIAACDGDEYGNTIFDIYTGKVVNDVYSMGAVWLYTPKYMLAYSHNNYYITILDMGKTMMGMPNKNKYFKYDVELPNYQGKLKSGQYLRPLFQDNETYNSFLLKDLPYGQLERTPERNVFWGYEQGMEKPEEPQGLFWKDPPPPGVRLFKTIIKPNIPQVTSLRFDVVNQSSLVQLAKYCKVKDVEYRLSAITKTDWVFEAQCPTTAYSTLFMAVNRRTLKVKTSRIPYHLNTLYKIKTFRNYSYQTPVYCLYQKNTHILHHWNIKTNTHLSKYLKLKKPPTALQAFENGCVLDIGQSFIARF